MLLKLALALVASATALAAPLGNEHVKRGGDLTAALKAADTAAERNQLLAATGNSSFMFDFANPPAAAVISTPPGKLISANPTTAPFLVDIDFSLAVVEVGPCGLILPHLHPRNEEFILVTQGEFVTQFIQETGAALITNDLKQWGATLFPRGSIHLEYNPTCSPSTFIAAFNGGDPGISFIAANFFSLEEQLVIANLGGETVVSGQDLATIQHAIPAGIAVGVQECLTKCGIKPNKKRSLVEALTS
jgi:hypothetical protein